MSFWDDIKKFAQPYAADDDYDYDDEDLDEGFQEESVPFSTGHQTATPAAESSFGAVSTPVSSFGTSSAVSGSGFSGTVLNANTPSNKQQLVLVRPESFGDAPEIATNLRNKKAVVLNLEGVDKALARRVVDFLSGCTYALDGSVKKISQATYLFCPYNMEVLGDLKNLQGEVESYI